MNPRIIVHLVHGTWGRGFLPIVLEDLPESTAARTLRRLVKATPAGHHWFETNSTFCQEVRANLPADLRDQLTFRPFLWSGSNSIAARTAAADQLRTYLEAAFTEAPDACHLVIAHSHGGVVTFEAVTRQSGLQSRQLDGILTLATPYLAAQMENGENILGKIMQGGMPTALCTFFFATLVLFTSFRFHHVNAWLASVLLGVTISLFLIPYNERPSTAIVIDILLIAIALTAAWGAFWTVFLNFPTGSPLAPGFARLLLLARTLSILIAVGLTWLLLIAARAAVIKRTYRAAFMLEDTVVGILSVATPFLVIGIVLWAFASSRPYIGVFTGLLLFWPLLVFLIRRAMSHVAPQTQGKRDVLPGIAFIHELPCPLLALRLPGDEASLAIAASLIMRQLASLFNDSLLTAKAAAPGTLRDFIPVTLLALISAALGIYAFPQPELPQRWAYPIGAFLGVSVVALLLIVLLCTAALILFCLSLLSIGLLALAVGPEVLSLVPFARVDCEPLPRCNPTDDCRLEIQWLPTEERANLRHSLYDLAPIRLRVAEWIKTRANLRTQPPQSNPTISS